LKDIKLARPIYPSEYFKHSYLKNGVITIKFHSKSVVLGAGNRGENNHRDSDHCGRKIQNK
jgi:hypothetical protein